MDTISLAKNILTAATGAAKGHAKDLKNYLKARVKLIADGTAEIATDLLKRKITEDDVGSFAFQKGLRSKRRKNGSWEKALLGVRKTYHHRKRKSV